MRRQTGRKKTFRYHHSSEFAEEALALVYKVGIAKAAKQIGLHNSQVYGLRTNALAQQERSECEQSQAVKVSCLKPRLTEQ